MAALIILDLNDNQLSELPDEIGDLTTLESLNLRENLLESLPESVVNLSGFDIFWTWEIIT